MNKHRHTGQRITEETADQARAAHGGANTLTAIVSAAALIFSAVSLYESVLKRPQLNVYVPPVIHYARDANGDFEVIAVPITIANTGARDGAILDMTLTGTAADGTTKDFYSAFFVDRDFFARGEGFDAQTRRFKRNPRPKLPFAPISVSGRSNYSGTVLFYTRAKAFPKLIAQKGSFTFTLTARRNADVHPDWLDRLLPKPKLRETFTVTLPYFNRTQLLSGQIYPMKRNSLTRKASATGDIEVSVPQNPSAADDNKNAPTR